MAGRMKAAQFNKETHQVSVNEVAIPTASEGQLLVKIAAASLCHSDLMMSQRPDGLGPLTIGHEGVGWVSKVHPSVEGCGFRPGDKIGMLGIIDSCFDCEGCQVHPSFCAGSRNGGAKINGLQADGYFAEYALVDRKMAILLPESLPMDRISPLFCAGITAFHAVDKCRLEPRQWIAIVGCGGLGQLGIRYAKAMNLQVIALDVNDEALRSAKTNGADAILNPRTMPTFVKQVRKLTEKRGCHAAIVLSDASVAFTTGLRSLMFNGLLMVVGIPKKPLELEAFAISTNLYRVQGASNGTAAEMGRAVEFTAKHGIVPDVEFRQLEEMPEMWRAMEEGTVRKRMVVKFAASQHKL